MQSNRNMNTVFRPTVVAPSSSSSSSFASSSLPPQQRQRQQRPPLNLYQCTAVGYVYERIGRVLRRGTLSIGKAFFVMAVTLLLLDIITRGQAHWAIAFCVILTFSGFVLIRQVATSKESRDNALRENLLRLPVLSLLLSCGVARFLVDPLVQKSTSLSGIFFTWKSFASLFRITAIVFLLGMSVMARYIGPQSIMRLSCVPLAINPVVASIRYFVKYPWSILEPSDVPGELLAAPNFFSPSPLQQPHRGRRFQRPTLLATLSQVLIGLIVGGIIAYIMDLDWFVQGAQNDDDDDDNDSRRQDLFSAVLAATLFTTVSHRLFHEMSHEMSPSSYTLPPLDCFVERLAHAQLLPRLVRTLSWSVVISGLAIMGAPSLFFFSSYHPTFLAGDGGLSLLMATLTLVTMLMQICLSLFDESIKHTLFCSDNEQTTSRQHHRSVESTIGLFTQESPTEYLKMVLSSLFMGNSSMVAQVVCDDDANYLSPDTGNYAKKEMDRIFKLLKQLGALLIEPLLPGSVEACLEEDVFRFAILESLGGPSSSSRKDGGGGGVIAEWASKGTRVLGRHGSEPLIVVLVRGLCIFLGGIGEALGLCFVEPPKNVRTVESWEVPVGVFACTTFALEALARCFVESFKEPTSPFAAASNNGTWKSTHLKVLIPVALNTLYHLRCGILLADSFIGGGRDDSGPYRHQAQPGASTRERSVGGTTNAFSMSGSNNDLKQLLAACEAVAIKILHITTGHQKPSSSSSYSSSPTTAMEFDHHVHNMPLLRPEALRWLKECGDSPLSGGRMKLD